MVHGQLLVEDFLQIGLDILQAEVETLEGLELVCDTGRKGAGRDVANVA